MDYKLRVLNPDVIAPDARLCAEAASRGIEVLVIDHLRKKNETTSPNRYGLPKSNYYAEASNNVESTVDGRVARVEVDHPGIALHYEGGTVLPKKKALAVPINPEVAGIWPSEAGGELDLFWPKNSSHGFLKDPETSELLYLLLPKATIPEDKTVLPTDDQIFEAAGDAIMEALS